ncbi:MAG: molecular chaperone TorD family protein [Candidatus Latescibacterota bacterium]
MTPQVRYFFYDLFFSMFACEPTDGTIDAWRRGLDAVRLAWPDEPVAEAAAGLVAALDDEGANEAVRAEFAQLFWRPEGPVVPLLGSQYVDGKPFGPYLVRMRAFVERTPFRKRLSYSDPEDSLPFHLDLMRSLIREESQADDPCERAAWGALQDELAIDLMGSWADRFAADLAQQQVGTFYRQVGILLRLQLGREQEFLLARRAPQA